MKKCTYLARVSSKEQEETGYSLPSQEKLLKKYAEKHNFHIAKSFSISESASRKGKERKIFDEMFKYVDKNKIKILIVEKVDRLTRTMKDAVMIDKWINQDEEREVHFVKEGWILTKNSKSHEKFVWNIKASVAQFYTDNLSEEVKKGQAEKLSQGWLPTIPPLGYKTIGEKGHRIHVIDKGTAPIIKKMFELYSTSNYSIKRVTKILDKMGLMSTDGTKISKSRVGELLSNPFYIGFNLWKGVRYEGKQETFISKELFDQVQDIKEGNTIHKYNKHTYLLKGLVKCSECNSVVSWYPKKGIMYGRCNHSHKCYQSKCGKEKEIMKNLEDSLQKLKLDNPRFVGWIRKALKESHKDQIETNNASLNKLNDNFKRIEIRLDKLYDDKLDSLITEDMYKRKFRQYTDEKQQILGSIEKYSDNQDKYYELGSSIFDLSQQGLEVYKKAKIDDRRDLIKLVFTDMTLGNGVINYKYSKPFQMLYEAVKATNSSKLKETGKVTNQNFELLNNTDKPEQKAILGASRPIWLGGQVSNHLGGTKRDF